MQTCMHTAVANASAVASGIFICPFLVEVHVKFAHSQTPHPQLWDAGTEREGM